MRLPLVRVGLLVIVGAAFASLMSFWVAAGEQAGDLSRDTDLTRALESRGALGTHFVQNFLFAGGWPGVLFYTGVALVVLGALRLLKARPPAPSA